jgi:hypothetical protein
VTDQSLPPDSTPPILEFFANSRAGFFVEVGVRNPTTGSMTWPLELSGWNGVLIEPQPDLAAFLVTSRRAKVFAAACVASDVAGTPQPMRVPSPLSSMDGGEPFNKPPASDYVIMAATRTLDDVLREAEAPVSIDLLALDAHGRELDALLGFDFERWQVRLIAIADPVVDLQRHRFLKESGYRLIRRSGGRGWYVPAGSPDAAQRERWPIVSDYYVKLPFRKARHALRRLKERIIASAQ